jgi:hypothetical protein
MPLTASAKAIALDAAIRGVAPSASVTHVGLMRWSEAGKAVTGVAATDIFTSTAHGYAAGDLVLFTATTGGAGLVVNDPYFVIATNLAANTFSVSKVPGGASVDTTTDLTAGTVRRLVELTGGSPAYARKAIAWAAASAALEQIDDSTNGAVVDVPAGVTVDYISGHSAVTAGTLMWIDDAPVAETFAAQGTYTVQDVKVNLTT